MSKIAEKKALEAYPTPLDNEPFISKGFVEEKNREGFIKGYDQAMQDFLDKACEWLSKQSMPKPAFWHLAMPKSLDWNIEDFKNYMQNESED